MSDGYKPTQYLRYMNRPVMIERDVVQDNPVLQQLWRSAYQGDPDEWRDVPWVEEGEDGNGP